MAQINNAISSEDWIMVADLLEVVCIPAIDSIVQEQNCIEINDYLIESTSSGMPTAKSISGDMYLHSNVNPEWEARQLAESIYDPMYRGYIVWGLGLGYFVTELDRLTDGSVPIRVFEEDDLLIDIAKHYGCITKVEQPKIEIIHDPLAKRFVEELSENTGYGVMIHLPSVKKIRNPEIRTALLDHYLHIYDPVREYMSVLKNNYYSNTSLRLKNVDEIEDKIRGKDVVVVAAGPSLDDNIDFLRSCEDKIIISVGTVLKKLLDMGITPDYCVILDPYKSVYGQIDGIPDCDVPLILGVSAYWKVGRDYKGPKMIAYTKRLAGIPSIDSPSKYVFDIGSSVTTLAIDLAMQMSAQKVYLVGADMAYKDGRSHTSGTQYPLKRDVDEMIAIEGCSGDTVYTTPTLNEVRVWIECEIVRYPEIQVYNLSKTGALIHGAELY
ncbi:MAG: DUF115 domain-containing protein [Lachnospiraceae bacterium]|nr:DUF115 domain-containing protein [Lachnospiraceae bacterium]